LWVLLLQNHLWVFLLHHFKNVIHILNILIVNVFTLFFLLKKIFHFLFNLLRVPFVKILILNKNFEIKKTFEPICDFYYNVISPCSLHYEKNLIFQLSFNYFNYFSTNILIEYKKFNLQNLLCNNKMFFLITH